MTLFYIFIASVSQVLSIKLTL